MVTKDCSVNGFVGNNLLTNREVRVKNHLLIQHKYELLSSVIILHS